MKKYFNFAFFFIFLIFSGNSLSGDKKKIELKELREELSGLEKNLKENKKEKKVNERKLKSVEKKINKLSTKIFKIRNDQTKIKEEILSLDRLQKEKISTINTIKRDIKNLIYNQYTHKTKRNSISYIFKNSDHTSIPRKIDYLSYILKKEENLVSNLKNELQDLSILKKKKTLIMVNLNNLEEEEKNKKVKFTNEVKKRKNIYNKISKKIKTQKKRINDLRKNERRLANLIKKLSLKKRNLNTKLPLNNYGKVKFSKLKGRLRLPAIGTLTKIYGKRIINTKSSWKGIFISSKTGESVKAIAAGEVVFADWLKGFGNLLILDHGSQFMSLYANNGSLVRSVGEMLNPGDTIAYVGNSGEGFDVGVYFELRHNGKPFNPIPWVNLK